MFCFCDDTNFLTNFLTKKCFSVTCNSRLFNILIKKIYFLTNYSTVLYCFAKQARILGANKLTKYLLDKINNLRVPLKFQEQVEILTVAARARPLSDLDELLPMCYRCSTYNPLTAASDTCINCGHKFVHSYVSFGKQFFYITRNTTWN